MGIIELILPNGNNKKYIKTIIGIYILFVIIYPIITKLSGNKINLNAILSGISYEDEKSSTDLLNVETNSNIEKTYITNLKTTLEEDLRNKGYKVNLLDIGIEKSEEKYGQINYITLRISKIDENKYIDNTNVKANNNISITNISKIEKIDINIKNSDNNNIKQNNENLNIEKINENEINTLKEYLNTTYLVKKDNIKINE